MTKVRIVASKAGSIGTKYCEKRVYEIEPCHKAELISKAIARAYADGLEHVLVTHIDGKATFNSEA